MIDSFCKVEFLCYAGEPNWLGWLVLFFFALVIGGFLLFWLFAFMLMIGIHVVYGFAEAFKWLRKIFKSLIPNSKAVDEKPSSER
jgi:hypothetical protein